MIRVVVQNLAVQNLAAIKIQNLAAIKIQKLAQKKIVVRKSNNRIYI